jgi:predicted DNA-binding transcriptional regulator AlpA
MNADDRLVDAVEAGQLLGLKPGTVRRLPHLPVVKPTGRRAVRYRLSDVQELIHERTPLSRPVHR